MQFIVTIFCTSLLFSHVAPEIPSYITPCKYKSSSWKECCLKSGREALKGFINGDRKLNVPKLNPLHLPEVQVDAGKELKIKFIDLEVGGLETTDLKRVDITLDEMKFGEVELEIPSVVLTGQYNIDGRILILPITGSGPMNITAVGGTYIYKFKLDLMKKKGVEYARLLEADDLEFKHKRIYLRFENLFNGNSQLGENTNTFLNENWKEVITELGGPIKETIRIIIRTIAGNLFKNVPYKELFLIR